MSGQFSVAMSPSWQICPKKPKLLHTFIKIMRRNLGIKSSKALFGLTPNGASAPRPSPEQPLLRRTLEQLAVWTGELKRNTMYAPSVHLAANAQELNEQHRVSNKCTTLLQIDYTNHVATTFPLSAASVDMATSNKNRGVAAYSDLVYWCSTV